MESALAELADQLNARNVKAKIYLVGGAVMVLAFDARFTTGDIDGSIHPTDDVVAVAAEIGERRGLGVEWLNNSAQRFIPVFKEPDWQPILKSGNVEIVVADERSMLAIKMRAGRGSRDLSTSPSSSIDVALPTLPRRYNSMGSSFPKTRFQIERSRCSTKQSRR